MGDWKSTYEYLFFSFFFQLNSYFLTVHENMATFTEATSSLSQLFSENPTCLTILFLLFKVLLYCNPFRIVHINTVSWASIFPLQAYSPHCLNYHICEILGLYLMGTHWIATFLKEMLGSQEIALENHRYKMLGWPTW